MIVPAGIATASATSVVTSVPATSGRTPYRGSAKSGIHIVSVRKSLSGTILKKGSDSTTRTMTIAIVVNTATSAASIRNASTTRSRALRNPRPAGVPVREMVAVCSVMACRTRAPARCRSPMRGGGIDRSRPSSSCLAEASPLAPALQSAQSLASRASSSSTLRPTSGTPPKPVPSLPFAEVLGRELVGLAGQRHVLHFLDQRHALGEVVLDELLDLGLLRRLLGDIDEDRARERLVASHSRRCRATARPPCRTCRRSARPSACSRSAGSTRSRNSRAHSCCWRRPARARCRPRCRCSRRGSTWPCRPSPP